MDGRLKLEDIIPRILNLRYRLLLYVKRLSLIIFQMSKFSNLVNMETTLKNIEMNLSKKKAVAIFFEKSNNLNKKRFFINCCFIT